MLEFGAALAVFTFCTDTRRTFFRVIWPFHLWGHLSIATMGRDDRPQHPFRPFAIHILMVLWEKGRSGFFVPMMILRENALLPLLTPPHSPKPKHMLENRGGRDLFVSG